jgi:hypothetical protein
MLYSQVVVVREPPKVINPLSFGRGARGASPYVGGVGQPLSAALAIFGEQTNVSLSPLQCRRWARHQLYTGLESN